MRLTLRLHEGDSGPTKRVVNTLAYLLPLFNAVPAIKVSQKTGCGILRYLKALSFVLNRRDSDGCSTVRTTLCVVLFTVRLALTRDMPHFLLNVMWSIFGDVFDFDTPTLHNLLNTHTLASNANPRFSSSVISAASTLV